VLAALASVLPLEPSADVLRKVLREYRGLEHRLEPAGELAGVRFVNDSKATNTDSLRVALQSFPEPVVLIAGGRDKGQDFRPLAPLVRRAVRHLVLIGEGADTLARAWPDASLWSAVVIFGPLSVPIHFLRTRRSWVGLGLAVFWFICTLLLIGLPVEALAALFHVEP